MTGRQARALAARLLWSAAVAAVAAVALAAAADPTAAAQAPSQSQAQGPPPSSQQPPRFRVATNFVQVDVYPTADNRPVTDLTAAEFEVLEDNTPQKIETFEFVTTRAPGVQSLRPEPSTVEAANDRAADPGTRAFVLFLDTYHVEGAAAFRVRQPLVNLLNRIVGQDDVVAVMTPEMSARDLTFTTRTSSIEAILDRYWDWGRRGQLANRDPQETQYEICYPADPGQSREDTLLGKMIDRRREKLTLDALDDLIVHLEGLREGRKAVVTVSDGWRLFREDRTMLAGEAAPPPGVYVGPGGKLGVGTDPRRSPGSTSLDACERDRISLAMLDNERDFLTLLDDANRANISFYPVDPRGLPAFDTPLGPTPPVSADRDAAYLRTRTESLRTMAIATDGIAVVDGNDLDRGLRRVVDDLTSYYLLGYYSTNSRPDGRFRKIAVRVRRPGVAVRARRGYRAPTEAELASRGTAGTATPGRPTPETDAAAHAVSTALGALALVRTDVPVRYKVGYLWRRIEPSGAAAPGVGAQLWVTGELDVSRATQEGWLDTADAIVTVSDASRQTVASSTLTFSRTARGLRVALPEQATLGPGTYDVRISGRSVEGRVAPTESFRVTVPALPSGPATPMLGQPALSRRGPFTGTTFQPSADPRFRRQEWIRVEVARAGEVETSAARVLDRTGRPLSIPVKTGSQTVGESSWLLAEAALAPLAAGEYLLEVEATGGGRTERVLAAFRIIP